MPDESINYGFESDPRIDTMVGKAADITELLLNADFLMGEYMVDYLKAIDCLEVAHEMGLTAEQRIKMVIWNTGLKEDPDGDTQTFAFMLAVLQSRANLGRQAAQKLMDDLSMAYLRIFRTDAPKEGAPGLNTFDDIRLAVAGHLSSAQVFLAEESVPSPDEDNEEE